MQKPNIILITIDSLRFDHLGCYGYSRDTSPNIDSLASKGALFLEAISNGGRTPDSFPSILASQLPPIDEGEYGLIMHRNPTLAGVLKGAGYSTAAFLSNPFLSKLFHYNEGFTAFEDSLGMLNQLRRRRFRAMLRLGQRQPAARILTKAVNNLGHLFNHFLFSLGRQRDVTASELTSSVISWLNSCSNSFFLWPHYMDAHYPYLPPSGYARQFCNRRISRYRMSQLYHKQIKNLRRPERLSQADMDTLLNLYDASIRYVDDNIGQLMHGLGSPLDHTIIVVTADHGETFGEHGSLGHGFLYDDIVHVPLIIAGPGIKAGTVVMEPVELLDLAPTIADLVRVGPVNGFHGKSLLPVISGSQREVKGIVSTRIKPESSQRSLGYRTPQWKYILTESTDKANTLLSEEVYDLKNDPQERHNRHGSTDEEVRTFELEAIDRLQRFKRLKSEERTAYEKDRIRAKLKKLPKL